MNRQHYRNLLAGLFIALPSVASATNGMNLEAYGPIAAGMGGASMAYDNGNAAMMNNPATLALMESTGRFDFAVGFLGPDVNTTVPTSAGGTGRTATSSADGYYMPAFGVMMREGDMTYGIGMFAQGGMGTEFAANSDLALITGEKVVSELSVGRLLAPITFRVNERLSFGATVDFVWAGLDLKMAVPASQLGSMSPSGSLAAILPTATATGDWGTAYDAARFDFDDESPYSGDAFGKGYAGKIGVVFQATESLTFGASYHSKTRLGDLKTNDAVVSLYDDTDGNPMNGAEVVVPMSGKITVKDFQWPSFIGAGASWLATPKVQLVMDIKHIQWAEVMESFDMRFENAMGELEVSMPQKWKDQTVVSLGGAYQFNEVLLLRAGYNYGKNPVPNSHLNVLFPAIVEHHYTLGFGYQLDAAQQVNFSYIKGKENVESGASGVRSSHGQDNWQLMYSYLF